MEDRVIRGIIQDQELLTCSPATSIIEAGQTMKRHNIGALVVVDNGKLAGIFTERDALFRVVAEGRDTQNTRVADVMTRKPKTIHPDRPFREALHIMHEGGFRHVPVVENDSAIGMISARDALGSELEDFVYEMLRDEQVRDVLA